MSRGAQEVFSHLGACHEMVSPAQLPALHAEYRRAVETNDEPTLQRMKKTVYGTVVKEDFMVNRREKVRRKTCGRVGVWVCVVCMYVCVYVCVCVSVPPPMHAMSMSSNTSFAV